MNITNLIGKRALITEQDNYGRATRVTEIKFLELAPSGNWVKLGNMNGHKYWKPVTEISLIEVLIDLRAGKPKQIKIRDPEKEFNIPSPSLENLVK